MTDDRITGLALIAGSAGVILALGLHPSGRDLFAPDTFESAARKLIAVHSLGLACLPVWLFGAWGLSRRLDTQWTARTALATYAFALMAMMNAVVVDGLVTPGLAREIVHATGTAAAEGWRIAFNHNSLMDQAFMRVFLVASSAAIVLWSVSILNSGALTRAVGIYGCVLGVTTVIAQFSGQLESHEHLFGAVIVGQAAWFLIVGAALFRVRNA
jgi:hypothetical protein